VIVPNPLIDADHVHHELIALHWLSHGKGATAKEISDALVIRGIKMPADRVWTHLLDLVDTGWAWRPGAHRNGADVYAPVERPDL